jgi:hypothetical protein
VATHPTPYSLADPAPPVVPSDADNAAIKELRDELATFVGLTLKEAAAKLRVTTKVLKAICSNIAMDHWSKVRQTKSICITTIPI